MIRQTSLKLASIISIFLIGCQSTNTQPPEWYHATQTTNDSYIYAVGQGRSLEMAKQSALSQISAQLWTEINSQFSSRDVFRTNGADETESGFVDSKINSKTATVTFADIEYIQTEKNDIAYFVQAKVSRDKIVQQLNSDIVLADRNAQQVLEKLTHQDSLLWWLKNKDKKDVQNTINARKAMLVALGVETTPNASSVNKMVNKIDEIQSGIVVQLSFKGSAKQSAQLLADKLSQQTIKTSLKRTPSATHTLSLKTELRQNKVGEAFISTQFTRLELTPKRGATLGSNEIISTGSSYSSYKISREGAERNFIDLVDEQGVWNALGL